MVKVLPYIVALFTLILGAIIGYFYSRSQAEKARRLQHEKADSIIQEAREQAKSVELQARDNALKITQSAEGDKNGLWTTVIAVAVLIP